MINLLRPKEYNIIVLINDLVAFVNGGHIVMCKSGKDRTSMSVTLEQVNFLYKNHAFPGSQRNHLLECMRCYGVRLAVVKKIQVMYIFIYYFIG